MLIYSKERIIKYQLSRPHKNYIMQVRRYSPLPHTSPLKTLYFSLTLT